MAAWRGVGDGSTAPDGSKNPHDRFKLKRTRVSPAALVPSLEEQSSDGLARLQER